MLLADKERDVAAVENNVDIWHALHRRNGTDKGCGDLLSGKHKKLVMIAYLQLIAVSTFI